MRNIFFGFFMILFLSSCGTQAATPEKGGPFFTPTPLSTPLPAPVIGVETPMSELVHAPTAVEIDPVEEGVLPDAQALRQLMLFSHTHWQNLWADGWVVIYAGDGSTTPLQVTHTQIWLDQPAKARVISGPQTSPQNMWISDGVGFSLDQGVVQELPAGIGQTFNPPVALSDTIQPYPLAGMLGTPLSDMLFPTALAQRGGEFQVIGQEEMAGRTAIVALWSFQPGGPVVDRMWIDAKSGIILRWINYSKPGDAFISSEMYFSALQTGLEFPEETFAVGAPLPLEYAEGPEAVD